MSSMRNPDLEAAMSNDSEESAKSNGSTAHPKPSRSVFRVMKFFKPTRTPSAPQAVPDGGDPTSFSPNDGLMRRTSDLRNAVEIGDVKSAEEVIGRLQKAKHEDGFDGFSIQDVSGNGLLQISALRNDVEMTEMLLDKGFKINDIDSNHGTALQAAIYMNYTAIISVLLDKKRKANVNTAGGYYGCALQVAAFKGSEILVKELLEEHKADVGTCGGKYGSVLQAAARTGLQSIVNLILNKVPEEGQKDFVNWVGGVYGTALQAAAKGPYTDQTRTLRCLSRGRVLKQLINIPRKASEVESNYVQVAETLINKGAEMKYDCGRLGSPIGAAASSGNLEMLNLLLKDHEKTATPKQLRQSCSYALISAITQDAVRDNRLSLVKSLVAAGADVDFETGSGLDNRPLTAAAAMGATTVIQHLLEKSPDPMATINADSGIYGTALRAALSAKMENAAMYLIERGAALYVKDNGTGTNTTKDEIYGSILHLAVFSEMNQVVRRLLGPTIHMSINLRDEVGQTALHIAAYLGLRDTVSILLEHKADPDLEDAWGDTPRKIADDVTERESHPGPSLESLRDISHQLLVASAAKPKKHRPDGLIHGPPIWKKPKASLAEKGSAKRVFASPTWNPGLGFKATISDFLQMDGEEYISIKTLLIDDLLYRKGAVDELMKLKDSKDSDYTRNLRWYHLPSNNMTWANILMKRLWTERHPKIACKSLWGTDPYFVSPDLAPHARFVTPQCERLIPDAFEGLEPQPNFAKGGDVKGAAKYDAQPTVNGPPGESPLPIEVSSTEGNQPGTADHAPKNNQPLKDIQLPKNAQSPEVTEQQKMPKTPKIVEKGQNTLFLAMPYLHWECYRSSEAVSRLLIRIKDESMQNLILRGSKSWRTYEAEPKLKNLTRSTLLESAKQKNEPATSGAKDKRDDPDDLLMRKYLFKRLPVHLRRTLDQYYYSYLADTRVRDRDQVITKVRNRELYNHTHRPHTDNGKASKRRMFGRSIEEPPNNSKDTTPPLDPNSPLVVVDQLWLWVLDRDTIITSFPRRRQDKDDGDLDPENRTDILETILRYLRSAKRHTIRDAYDLSELIISQCVGILHRADVISDVDVLEIFGKEADGRVDEVMQNLTAFVKEFKAFKDRIEDSHKIDNEYVTDFERIFSVTKESLLLREIQDIKDELNMLAAVFKDQLDVLRKTGKTIAEDRERLPETRSSAFNFQQQSEKHARHVERMRVQASQAYDMLKDLLDLKQQQASVLEARASRNQTLAAGEQGKIILVFTIVTIIFLPLTFMTTVFTLPVLMFNRYDPTNSTTSKPDGGLLNGGDTFGIIVGVSLLMAVPAIVVAFQVKRLQVWWENMETKWRKRKEKQGKPRQKREGSQSQGSQPSGMPHSAS